MLAAGLVAIGIGLIYLWKPTLYRRGLWLKTSVAIRLLSEDGYRKYMRGLGVTFVVIGLALVLWALFAKQGVRL